MKTLSTITMAMLCVMLVAACQKETPDPGIGWEALDIEAKNKIETVDKEIKELIEAFEEVSFGDLNEEQMKKYKEEIQNWEVVPILVEIVEAPM